MVSPDPGISIDVRVLFFFLLLKIVLLLARSLLGRTPTVESMVIYADVPITGMVLVSDYWRSDA